jgi:hypothetical protein
LIVDMRRLPFEDPDRNGGRNLSLLHEHLAHDDLVAWGWQPGEGRDPAPGSQALLGQLIQAWIDTGAQCPKGECNPTRLTEGVVSSFGSIP